jgi:hypothetical protein
LGVGRELDMMFVVGTLELITSNVMTIKGFSLQMKLE